ncbi:restriction endonuclease subunit S [Lactobacillus melliventris]|uniref:restriction endonuclease subunit S n=1 Tax=Lactobacillus melliventris TaxID=1218507 RepID=UPI00164F547D|nr:restriction endonuclease subunit S [Lactobacillus melliventris]MBC6348767.1 hypothetical protein [Lactobacillus melliventris]
MKYLKLKEIAKLKNGKKCNYDVKGIIPVYGSNGIIGYTDNLNSPENSIIIGRVGANAGSVFYSFKKHWVTDNAISVVPNINKINSFYLYYALYSLDLNRLVEGSAQPLLNQSILNSLEIRVPPLSVQNSIVEKIRAFDEKIAVNNQINDNLLDIAKNIYHRILFSSQITKTNLRSFATVVMGQSPSSKTYNENKIGIPLLNGAADFRNGIHPSKWTTDPKIIVNKGAYIFGVRATIGLTAKVSKPYAIGRGTGSAIPKDVNNEEILYFILNDMFKKFEQTESGSVYINISKNDFENYRFNIPDRNGLLFFHEKVKPIMDQIYINKKQNKILQTIKATLLSKIF